MSSTPSPFARAQMAIRPKLKPKSPLRRQSVNVPHSPISPSQITTTMFNKSPSTSSSLSGHGTLSTSTSASSDMDKQSQSTVATIKLGEIELSLPLLATTGVGVFVGLLLLRAIYTFSTSILRLFVMVIAVWAFLTFSQLNDRQKERQLRKKVLEERMRGTGDLKLNPADFQNYGMGVNQSSPVNGGGGYASGYGHARYPTANSPLQSPTTTYAPDGRTRNLLSPHQRFATYST